MQIEAISPQEHILADMYTQWEKTPESFERQYSVALFLALNGEDDRPMIRPEFALALLTHHAMTHATWNALMLRAWFVWWTRAEQKMRAIENMHSETGGYVKTILWCARANAWFKAWHWAQEEKPEDASAYWNEAQTYLSHAAVLLKDTHNAMRTMLQMALKDETWFHSLENYEQQRWTL